MRSSTSSRQKSAPFNVYLVDSSSSNRHHSHTAPTEKRPATASPRAKVVVAPPKYAPFLDKWVLYYHDLEDTNWTISSYTVIANDICEPEQLVAINETLPECIVKNAMLFVMRKGMSPMWESPCHRNGGYLSLKVPNKTVYYVWKSLVYGLCGETLFVVPEINSFVSGISVSSKNLFCIVKIWMSTCDHRDAELMRIPHLDVQETKFTPFTETKEGRLAVEGCGLKQET